MPYGYGYKARTRNLFARLFKCIGYICLSTYHKNYKTGDYVDIMVNSGSYEAIPHKTYHGRTGVVWNVTDKAVGVEINKQVFGRILKKRVHVRIEHLQSSRCRLDFIYRSQENQMFREKTCLQNGNKRSIIV